jgi:excisionase family DNA binding protein
MRAANTPEGRSLLSRGPSSPLEGPEPNSGGCPESPATAVQEESVPPVLTVEEAALLLRVNKKTVYEAVARGQLPGVRRIGKSIRLYRDSLLAWLAAGRAGRSR